MRRLRAGLIGSISAWLPARRSTAHHSGARSITVSGQVRSGRLIASTSSANGRYRWTGIAEVRWVFQPGWPGPGGPDGVRIARTPGPPVKAWGLAGWGGWLGEETMGTVLWRGEVSVRSGQI